MTDKVCSFKKNPTNRAFGFLQESMSIANKARQDIEDPFSQRKHLLAGLGGFCRHRALHVFL